MPSFSPYEDGDEIRELRRFARTEPAEIRTSENDDDLTQLDRTESCCDKFKADLAAATLTERISMLLDMSLNAVKRAGRGGPGEDVYMGDFGHRMDCTELVEAIKNVVTYEADDPADLDSLDQLRQMVLEYESCKGVQFGNFTHDMMERSSEPFEVAWDSVMKMPFVPGSVRLGELQEGDENYKDRQTYLADFFDPVDKKTRQMNILPTWERKTKPKMTFNFMGGGPPPEGTSVDIELDDDELREPEELFGREQRVPFGYFYRNANLDRLFSPSHMRRRGMGTAIVDAMQEYREKILGIPASGEDGWGQITDDSDNLQTEDMFRFWHSRGYMPDLVYPIRGQDTQGGEQYYQREYKGIGKRPNWMKQGPSATSFEEGWENAVRSGQYKLGADAERDKIYDDCYEEGVKVAKRLAHLYPDLDPENDSDEIMERAWNAGHIDHRDWHYDGGTECDCWAGHPWYREEDGDSELHQSRMHLFPNSWGYKTLFDEEGMWQGVKQ